MSIGTTLVRRGLTANIWRLLLTASAVVLGVAFVSASFVLRDSLSSAFNGLAADINKGIDVQVRTKVAFGDTNRNNPVPASLVPAVQAVPGVAAAEGSITALGVTVIGRDGKAVVPNGAPTLGVSWSAHEDLSPLHLVAGQRPRGRDEVALDKAAASAAGYVVGDTVRVSLPTGKHSARLSGLLRFGSANSLAGAYLVAFDPAVASDLLGLGGGYSTIDVQAVPGVSDEQLAQRVGRALPRGYEALTNAEVTAEGQAQFATFVNAFANGLLAFALIALFVSAFIINNTFAILASQRLRELALLRALGASSRQVRRMMAGEALVIGVGASVTGVVVGVGLGALLKAVLGSFLGGLNADMVVGASPVVAGLLVGIVITFASALAPAVRAGRVAPMQAMSAQGTLVVDRPGRRLVVAGLAAVVGGAGLVVGLFARPGDTVQWLTLAGVGAVLLFLGVAGLSRLVARPVVVAESAVLRAVARGLSAPVRLVARRPHRPVVAQLARENVARTPRRTSAAAAALMIGLAFVTTGSIIGASIKSTIRATLRQSITADLFLQDKGFAGFPAEVTDAVGAIDGVEAVSGYTIAPYRIGTATKAAGVVDHRSFGRLVDIGLTSGSFDALTRDTILLHKDPARDLRAHVGSKIRVEWPSSRRATLTVVGIYTDSSVVGNSLIDQSTYSQYFTGPRLDFFAAASVTPGASVQTVQRDVQTYLLDAAPAVTVQDKAEFQKSREQIVDTFVVTINVLLALAVFIALIGIANTLALSVHERTREIGLMRAVGMLRAQTRSMVRWESVLVAVFGALLGVALGIVLGTLVALALPSTFVSTVTIPTTTLVVDVMAAVVAGMAAAFFPARRAARMNVLEAIAQS